MGLELVKDIIKANGVGASEIAAIAGISPWDQPWDVYAKKKGLFKKDQTESMFWGKQLEPIIARVFGERMRMDVEWWDKTMQSPENIWMYASPDAFVLNGKGRAAVLECKTAGMHQAGEWDRIEAEIGTEDQIPEQYLCQVQWQMSVTRLDLAYIAVLIAGQDFRVYRIENNPSLAEILIEEGEKFWREHLMSDVAPTISYSEEARAYLRKRFPKEESAIRKATESEKELLEKYRLCRNDLDEIQDEQDTLENQICQAIGTAEGIEYELGKFTWKRTKDASKLDAKALASDPDAQALIKKYTKMQPGVRRIHWTEKEAK